MRSAPSFMRHHRRAIKFASLLLAAMMIAGCANPVNTRESSPFKQVLKQQFDAALYGQVSDCVIHGMNARVGYGFPDRTRVGQQTFSAHSRIETINGTSIVLASVDIYKNGAIEMYESLGFIGNTNAERKVVLRCAN